MHTPKIGLALSGGAALGAAHIGVMQSLSAHNIPISCVAGTSAGAIIGALHAFNVSPERTIERLSHISWRSVGRLAVSKYGFISNDALGDVLQDLLGSPNIEDARIPLSVAATDITHGELVTFREGPLIPALLASSCIPGIFSPVVIGDRMLVDGGLINNFPVSELHELGADITIGVNVIPRTDGQQPTNWFDVMNRSFDIISQGRYRDVDEQDIIIRPNLSAYSYSSLNQALAIIAEGRRATDHTIDRIHEAIDTYNEKQDTTAVSRALTRTKQWLTGGES